MLKFFGRGSAFCDEQNSAYFTDKGSLILIDCPMSSFMKIKKIGADTLAAPCPLENIIVLVTHTHGDHVGGIPMLIHFAYFVLHIPVTVIAPSKEVSEDMEYLLDRLEGCEGYELITSDEAGYPWLGCSIPTKHTPPLEGRCFGYSLNIDGKNVVYTGDTNTLEPYMPFIANGTELYTEISAVDSGVHLFADDVIGILKDYSENGVTVYLMHIDNEEKILSAVKGTKLLLAPLYGE